MTTHHRIWKQLNRRGEQGATDHELQTALRMNPSTVRPRRVELVERQLVIDSGRRRPTKSGRLAVVWVVREPARTDRASQGPGSG